MDNSNKTQKGKKVGADGLTKKERRAIRVNVSAQDSEVKQAQSETESITNKSVILSSTPVHTSPPSNDKINVIKTEIKEQTVRTTKQISASVGQGDDRKELSKAELRIQRKTMQEAQRAAKAAAVKEQPSVTKSNKAESANEISEVDGEIGPSKALLRVQRRSIQEAQRLAKANVKTEQDKQQNNKIEQKQKTADKKTPSPKKEIVKSINKHKVLLFNHLYFERAEISNVRNDTVNISGVHAAFLKLGAQYSSKTILGSNARCLALLSALKSLIMDFVTPSKQELCRSLESTLQTCVSHLNNCRPLAVSMTNALRHFKLHLTQINTNLSDNEKKAKLLECVETYIFDEINKAGEAISIQVRGKITNGDIILTYGCSSLITRILLDAYKEGKKFKVIVVDARPLLEGREMLRKLVCAGIQCTYVLINAASFVMGRVSKVLLGAHALLANGYVMSRTGTAQVALMANACKKPVLVCCETYKFSERVQTDSFVYNEIGDPNDLLTIDTAEESSPLISWQNSNYLTPLNLLYDVTPPDLVTAVVTELAFLPCTSVPVILRIRPTEIIT